MTILTRKFNKSFLLKLPLKKRIFKENWLNFIPQKQEAKVLITTIIILYERNKLINTSTEHNNTTTPVVLLIFNQLLFGTCNLHINTTFKSSEIQPTLF